MMSLFQTNQQAQHKCRKIDLILYNARKKSELPFTDSATYHRIKK